MKKTISIDQVTLKKLEAISEFENMSITDLMEKAVKLFVKSKELEQLRNLSQEELEDLGLLLLMQQVDRTDTVSEEEFLKALEE